MIATKTKAGALAALPALKYGIDGAEFTARRPDPQAGKWLAVQLYCAGTRSLNATQADFCRHPSWRSA